MLGTVVDFANTEPVGIRVLNRLEDFGDNNLVDRHAALMNRGDLETRAAEEVFQLGGGKLAVDEIAEPVDRDFHGWIRIV
jgi:hypothetical protein